MEHIAIKDIEASVLQKQNNTEEIGLLEVIQNFHMGFLEETNATEGETIDSIYDNVKHLYDIAKENLSLLTTGEKNQTKTQFDYDNSFVRLDDPYVEMKHIHNPAETMIKENSNQFSSVYGLRDIENNRGFITAVDNNDEIDDANGDMSIAVNVNRDIIYTSNHDDYAALYKEKVIVGSEESDTFILNGDHYVAGGEGNDSYNVDMQQNGHMIIDSYDKKGEDTLILNVDEEDIDVLWAGDDLLVVYNGDDNPIDASIRLENFKIDEDYRPEYVFLGNNHYTADSFLDVVDLSL